MTKNKRYKTVSNTCPLDCQEVAGSILTHGTVEYGPEKVSLAPHAIKHDVRPKSACIAYRRRMYDQWRRLDRTRGHVPHHDFKWGLNPGSTNKYTKFGQLIIINSLKLLPPDVKF